MQRPVSGKQGLESQSRAWGAWGPFPAALSAGSPRPHVLSAVRSGPAHAGRALPGGTCPGLGPWGLAETRRRRRGLGIQETRESLAAHCPDASSSPHVCPAPRPPARVGPLVGGFRGHCPIALGQARCPWTEGLRASCAWRGGRRKPFANTQGKGVLKYHCLWLLSSKKSPSRPIPIPPPARNLPEPGLLSPFGPSVSFRRSELRTRAARGPQWSCAL